MDCAEQPKQINKTEIIELRNNANSTRLSIDVEKSYPLIISQRIRTIRTTGPPNLNSVIPDYRPSQSKLCHPELPPSQSDLLPSRITLPIQTLSSRAESRDLLFIGRVYPSPSSTSGRH